MSDLLLGIGDYGVSRDPGGMVKTYALGSCVALILLDPRTRCVGMVHVALPDSSINPEKKKEKPGYFADSGVPALMQEMTRLGCQANGRGMIVKLAGGAAVMTRNDTFNIGKRNILAIKKALWTLGMGTTAEDVGGHISRTVSVAVSSGEITIYSPGRGEWQI